MAGEKANAALFKNKKRSSNKSPDFLGNVKISRAFARELADKFRNSREDEIELNASAWNKTPKDTKKDDYISVSIDFRQEDSGQRRGSSDRGRDDGRRDAPRRDDRRDSRDDGRRSAPPPQDFDDEIPF